MDQTQAIKILAKEIGNNFGRRIVRESIEKDELFNASKFKHSVANPVIIEYSNAQYTYDHTTKKGLEDILTLPDGFENANYYFLDSNHSFKKEVHFWVTPYAIIRDEEKELLKNSSYQEASSEINQAMDSLNIESFHKIYEVYKKYPLAEHIPDYFNPIVKFMIGVKNATFDKDDETLDFTGNKTDFSKLLQKLGINSPLNVSGAKYIKRKCLNKIVDELRVNDNTAPLLEDNRFSFFYDFPISQMIDFLNFAFQKIPYEDQNPNINKMSFAICQDQLSYIDILAKEYSGGRYFEDYFSCLTTDKQNEFVNHIKKTNYSNLKLNQFLRTKGFKHLAIDPVSLYQSENAREFIEYFKGQPEEEKKTILETLFKLNFENPKVTEWLDKNESGMITEVGFKQ